MPCVPCFLTRRKMLVWFLSLLVRLDLQLLSPLRIKIWSSDVCRWRCYFSTKWLCGSYFLYHQTKHASRPKHAFKCTVELSFVPHSGGKARHWISAAVTKTRDICRWKHCHPHVPRRAHTSPPDSAGRVCSLWSGRAGACSAPRHLSTPSGYVFSQRSAAQCGSTGQLESRGRRGPAVIKESVRDRVTLHNVVYINRATNPKNRLIVPRLSG